MIRLAKTSRCLPEEHEILQTLKEALKVVFAKMLVLFLAEVLSYVIVS